MNCVGCDYLLWDLPENRCPECGLPFQVTDYAFAPKSVEFVCPCCDQTYQSADICHPGFVDLDENGRPTPRRRSCIRCGRDLDVPAMRVRPVTEKARGEPLRDGTPWSARRRVGRVPAFFDGVARLATQPHEYFRLSHRVRNDGALLFSVICAYVSVAALIGLLLLFQRTGLLGRASNTALAADPHLWVFLLLAIPAVQLGWAYVYGFFIYIVLRGMGLRASDWERSIRAVAYGSAVLPALMVLPPVGLPWYLNVVASGVEQYNATTRGRALLATLIPVLLIGNIAAGIALAVVFV
ncbi:MAG: hypothetical protein ACE5E1_01275 [Phycisphaerae bacterium]